MYRAILLLFITFGTIVHVVCALQTFNTPEETPKDTMNVGLILPHTTFGVREYRRAINNAVSGLHRSRGPRLEWLKKYNFAPANVPYVLMRLTPSPTGLKLNCFKSIYGRSLFIICI